MGHMQERQAQAALQVLQLDLHLLAHLAIQGGERFVEQKKPRPVDDGAGQRDALLLAARQLARPPLSHRLHAHHLQRLGDLLLHFAPATDGAK